MGRYVTTHLARIGDGFARLSNALRPYLLTQLYQTSEPYVV